LLKKYIIRFSKEYKILNKLNVSCLFIKQNLEKMFCISINKDQYRSPSIIVGKKVDSNSYSFLFFFNLFLFRYIYCKYASIFPITLELRYFLLIEFILAIPALQCEIGAFRLHKFYVCAYSKQDY
jgi:hypothetical protein